LEEVKLKRRQQIGVVESSGISYRSLVIMA